MRRGRSRIREVGGSTASSSGRNAASYVAWVAGTAVGVFAGNVVTDPEAIGLDVVFPRFSCSCSRSFDEERTLSLLR